MQGLNYPCSAIVKHDSLVYLHYAAFVVGSICLVFVDRVVSRGHYSEKDAAKAVKEMLVAVKVSRPLRHDICLKMNKRCRLALQ